MSCSLSKRASAGSHPEQWSPMEATSEELFGQRESQLKLASKETRSFGGRKVLLASNELLSFEASFGWLSS